MSSDEGGYIRESPDAGLQNGGRPPKRRRNRTRSSANGRTYAARNTVREIGAETSGAEESDELSEKSDETYMQSDSDMAVQRDSETTESERISEHEHEGADATVASVAEELDVAVAENEGHQAEERKRTRNRKKAPKKRPKTVAERRQLYFDRMDQNLKEQHPDLRSVFPDLENAAERVPEPVAQPEGLRCTLLPFQKEGVGWMLDQEQSQYHGGILADEMGMGKTIQTIALFLSDKARENPILVIAPTVAVVQWANEIAQYAGDALKVLIYHGSNRSNDINEIAGYDVVITTYAVLESSWRKQQSGFVRKGNKVRERSPLHNMTFHRIVLDEAHNIKDRHASTSVAVYHLRGDRRLCLSGTPLQNRVGELYSLLRFLQIKPFCEYFCTKCDCRSTEWRVKGQRCLECNHVAMQHVNFFNHSLLKHILKLEGQQDTAIRNMRLLLGQIMLRRTKVERADDLGLPPRVVTVRRDYFNEEEKDLYASVFSDSNRQFSTYVNQGVVLNNYANIFTLITRMRQIADHPDLVLRRATGSDGQVEAMVCKLCDDEAEEPIESRCHHIFCRMCIKEYVEGWTGSESELECPVCHVGLTIDLEGPALEVNQDAFQKGSIINRIRMDDTWRSSTKIEALVEELFRLRSDRQTIKSIVFSQFTSMLDLVAWRLARAGFQCVKLQGSMSPAQRDSIIRYFMDTPSVEVFLVSLKAGGVALNLCEASQVFLLDPWWNPSVEWQSGDRVHRIGQHRPVTITRLVIEDSIESRIIELQEKKANMINATIGSDDSALNRLTQADMEFLFHN